VEYFRGGVFAEVYSLTKTCGETWDCECSPIRSANWSPTGDVGPSGRQNIFRNIQYKEYARGIWDCDCTRLSSKVGPQWRGR
jgi:hypothetical protein